MPNSEPELLNLLLDKMKISSICKFQPKLKSLASILKTAMKNAKQTHFMITIQNQDMLNRQIKLRLSPNISIDGVPNLWIRFTSITVISTKILFHSTQILLMMVLMIPWAISNSFPWKQVIQNGLPTQIKTTLRSTDSLDWSHQMLIIWVMTILEISLTRSLVNT